MVHTNNLRYMGVYRGPIKGQIGLYKGQKGQISYLIEIASVTHADVFFPRKMTKLLFY